MKHFRSTFATVLSVFACAALIMSCSNNKNSYELHQTNFYPVESNGIYVYADQIVDSTHVISTDNWTFTTTNASWLTAATKNHEVAPFTITVPVGYIVKTGVYFAIEPNTTGKMRTGLLTATSVYEKIGTVQQFITQAPYLNISTPSCTTIEADGTTRYSFTLNGISADGKTSIKTDPKITFIVYSSDATLTSSEDWITLEKDGTDKALTFEPNVLQTVNLKIGENKTGQQRSATLTLTSNGVSTPITVVQEK